MVTMLEFPCCLAELIQWLIILVILAFLLLCVFVKLTTDPYPKIENYEQEKTFKVSKSSSELKEFPSIDDPGSVDLSVIVPAYNEELRLPKMLDECLEFLNKRKTTFEVIIVDDGSKDSTTDTAMEYVDKFGSDKVRVLKLAKNRGKGGAVRMGMLKAR